MQLIVFISQSRAHWRLTFFINTSKSIAEVAKMQVANEFRWICLSPVSCRLNDLMYTRRFRLPILCLSLLLKTVLDLFQFFISCHNGVILANYFYMLCEWWFFLQSRYAMWLWCFYTLILFQLYINKYMSFNLVINKW